MNPSLCIVVEIIIWAIQGNLDTEGFKAEVLGTSLTSLLTEGNEWEQRVFRSAASTPMADTCP